MTAVQRRWTTIEKECYAIYYALKELDYLIHDSKFLLQTDHLNLMYINKPKSIKVTRWKLLIQMYVYDFNVLFIAGKDNVMADALSRLCEDSDDNPGFSNINSKEKTLRLCIHRTILVNYVMKHTQD